jgi:hypothetical protein
MKPKFAIGQRVRVVRASPDWDAPVGALGVVASYEGANYRGTDWEVGFLRDGAVACEPPWPIDESCLGRAAGGAFDPLPFEGHCQASDGCWMDEIITSLCVEDLPDRDARLRDAIALLQPVVGGTPLVTEYAWHPSRDGAGDVLNLLTTWCASFPWAGIIASFRRRFPESSSIVDDGWRIELNLQRQRAKAFLGADVVDFRLFVEPWSSFERRPTGIRYQATPPPW